MIQFFGLHLDADSATVAIIGRDLSTSVVLKTSMVNAVRDAVTGIIEVPTAEWVRAGCYALQESYFKLPVPARKAWGLGLAGPSGWIALDIEFEPLSPLRLTGDLRIQDDFQKWAEQNQNPARKVAMILSPKDYFRFVISGGLAADVSTASRWGLLLSGRTDWCIDKATEQELRLHWLPPAFDAHVMTGFLSEDGIRRTSLPGGFRLVAGAHEVEAALVTVGDLRDGRLWEAGIEGGGKLYAMALSHTNDVAPPRPWRAVRSAWQGFQLLEREAEVDASEARAELEAAGFPVTGQAQGSGSPAMGAAVLTAIGSGLIRGWENYYRNRRTE